MGQSATLQKTLSHLEAHYPELIGSIEENHDFLNNLRLNPWSGKVFIEMVNIHREEIVHAEGLQHIGYDQNEWTFNKSLKCVPYGYGKLHESYLSGLYNLFYFCRLMNSGVRLRVEKPTLLRHASNKIYQAHHETWIMPMSQSDFPILIINKFTLHGEWTIHHPPPLMCPQIFVGDDRHKGYEAELIKLSTHKFLTAQLNMNPNYVEILGKHLEGLINEEIAKVLDIKVTTVNWRNTEILKVCGEHFSTFFTQAAQWAKYFQLIKILDSGK